jgi:thimet oligopeptidase
LFLALAGVALAGCQSTPSMPAAQKVVAGDDSSPISAELARAGRGVEEIVAVPDGQRTFENTLGRLDDMLAQLELDTNITMFMAYVSTDTEERDTGQQAEEDFSNWLIDLFKREDLYRAVKTYADTRPKLAGERARLLEHTLRDFRRAGMALSSADRGELKEIQKEITKLSIEFEQNIREDNTRVPLTREELVGVPEDYFANPDLERSGDLYLVSMAYPQFNPIQTHCANETTRRKVWIAYKRRGGKQNVELIEKILQLRAEAADLLGYRHPADYETEVRMTKNADTVKDFYKKLRPLVRKKAKQDYQELLDAKIAETGDGDAKLGPWDTYYYINYLKKTRYAVDSEKVREYFPLDRVIDGLFSITQSLYGLEYRDVTDSAASRGLPIWHEDVRLYEVREKAGGELLGEFFLDLYPRPNKYSHAAQWGLAQHKVWSDGRVTRPLAALVCNFTKPTAGKPSLLTHDEVETFFHEFGHCLHTILSEGTFYRFGGTQVERDFVEAPSQMFENWIWDAGVLKSFARHYETNEPFPDELLEGMMRARHLASGMLAERQFFYGLYDMNCHTARGGKVDTTQLAHDLWDPRNENVELYDPVESTYFQAAFGHLVGYQAGYYGYQWSLVYACDMFERFKELGMLDPDAGRYYRQHILARGGTEDGMDLVRAYLGREPEMDAYLAHLGLEE